MSDVALTAAARDWVLQQGGAVTLRELSEGPYRIELEGFWRWQRLAVEGAVSPWRPR